MNCEKCRSEIAEYEVLMTDLETYSIGKNCKNAYKSEILECYRIM